MARTRVSGYCEQAGEIVVKPGMNWSTKVQSYPQCNIAVYYSNGPKGTVSTSGTSVTWRSGTPFNGNSGWVGLTMNINSVTYTISSVVSSTSITLGSSAGTQTSANYTMASTAPAAIFSDNSGTPASNPFTSSATGYWAFYPDNGIYDVKMSEGGIQSPFTWSAISAVDAQSPPVTVSDVGYFYRGQSLDTACLYAASIGATLSLNMFWPNLATQALPCSISADGGILQPSSSAVVTLSGHISALRTQRIFDISLSGATGIVITPPPAAVYPESLLS